MIFMHNEIWSHKNNNLIKNHEDDMGYDIRSGEDFKIPPRSSVIVNTYLHIAMPLWLGMIIKSRSGLAFKHDIEASNAGVIDSGFHGGFKVKLYNEGFNECFYAKQGDRIAQAIFHIRPEGYLLNSMDRITPFAIRELDIAHWPESSRGTNGFESSGRD